MWRLAAVILVARAVHPQSAPAGRLSGRVLFPDGSPVAGAQVTLLYRLHDTALGVQADSQGRFAIQIRGALLGRFVIVAAAPKSAKAPGGEAWAPTYFPDAIDETAAQVAHLKPGADLDGYDIRLRSLPVYSVRGTVRDDLGNPAAGVRIDGVSSEGASGIEAQVVSGEDGSFRISALRTGEWRLTASLKRGDVELKAVDTIRVKRADLDGVSLRLDRPFPLAIVMENAPAGMVGIVRLLAEPPRQALTQTANAGKARDRVVLSVYPARYRIVPLAVEMGHYPASVKLGDREVLGQAVDLVPGVPPLRVVYSSEIAAVRVRVDNGARSKIVLVPQEESLRIQDFSRFDTADDDGRGDIGSIRPGDYYAFAFDRFNWPADAAALQDPEFFRILLPRAARVRLEKNQTSTVDLKVTAWPE